MALTNVFLILSEPGFMKRKDGEGHGTNASNLPGSIEVLEFGFEIEQVGTGEPGRPRNIERVDRTEVKVTKAVDSRSPALFRYCCEGTFIYAAEIQIYGPVPDTPYLVYRLQHVHVKSYSPSGGSSLPTEDIGLTFGEMGVHWDEAGMGVPKQGNTKLGSLHHNWSWVSEWPVTIGDPIGRIRGMEGEKHNSPG